MNVISKPADQSTEDVDLGPLGALIGYALRRAQMAVFQDFSRANEAETIRPAQYSVLKVLHQNPGLRQTQVSGALGIKRANFVPMLDELQGRGLIERRAVPADKRANGLFLTATGTELLSRLDENVAAHEARCVARIGAQGKQDLLALLRQLTDPL